MRKRRKKPFALGRTTGVPCCHCHRVVRQLFMVYDDVWLRAIRDDRGMGGYPYLGINMHVGCIERRISRRLRARDFFFQDRKVKRR